MAEVYEPQPAEGFEYCHPDREEDFANINDWIDGTPKQGTWNSPPMHLVRQDEGRKLSESDSPWFGSHALIFRRHAISRVEKLLLSNGELLPLNCGESDLVIFNATRVLDALDGEASRILRFSTGRVMRVTRYAFRPDVLEGIDIFKLPDFRVSPTYLSTRVVEQFKSAGLRGLAFKRVWHR